MGCKICSKPAPNGYVCDACMVQYENGPEYAPAPEPKEGEKRGEYYEQLENPDGKQKPPTIQQCRHRVTKIQTTLPATQGLNNPERRDDHVFTTTSPERNMQINKPTILVRGCNKIRLDATTDPAGGSVKWEIESTNGKNEQKPPLTSLGNNAATLDTSCVGSYSVIAECDGTSVVWNVVFVWVRPIADEHPCTVRSDYHDGEAAKPTDQTVKKSGAGYVKFASGDWLKDKNAFEASAELELIGGGDYWNIGTDKTKVHVLQNVIEDTLAGVYADGSQVREIDQRQRLPLLDANIDANQVGIEIEKPYLTAAGAVTEETVNKFKCRIGTSDNPSGKFKVSKEGSGSRIVSITGVNEFRTAIIAVSDDAPRSFVVCAEVRWQANFDGQCISNKKADCEVCQEGRCQGRKDGKCHEQIDKGCKGYQDEGCNSEKLSICRGRKEGKCDNRKDENCFNQTPGVCEGRKRGCKMFRANIFPCGGRRDGQCQNLTYRKTTASTELKDVKIVEGGKDAKEAGFETLGRIFRLCARG